MDKNSWNLRLWTAFFVINTHGKKGKKLNQMVGKIVPCIKWGSKMYPLY